MQILAQKKRYTLFESKKKKNIEHLILKEYNNYDFHKLKPDIIKKVRKLYLVPDVNEFPIKTPNYEIFTPVWKKILIIRLL